MKALPPRVEAYLERMAERVHEVLQADAVGVYLHGSAVLGGFHPDRSDLDVLVVCDRPLSADQRAGLCQRLGRAALAVPAAMLELSVVTAEACRQPVAAPRYELHVNTRDDRCVDGTGRNDPDLLLHFAVARQVGRLLGLGPTPRHCFAPVPRQLVLDGMALELRDAAGDERAAPEYLVLNACRNLAYLRTGRMRSKVAGGRWVLAHDPSLDHDVVAAALDRQDGTVPDAPLDSAAALSQARMVAALLSAERQDRAD
jgi:predicted nucleotidyltransferase